jgi:hypothetical protein
MKLYTFLNENDEIIEEVRAKNHDHAVMIANGWKPQGSELVTFTTDFYSEEVK